MSQVYHSQYIYFPEKNKVVLKDETISSEGLLPTECIIQAETSIISAGTELSRLNDVDPANTLPCRPGYGMIGRIIEKGSSIKEFNIGDRVFFAGKHQSIQRFNHGEPHQWAYLFPVPEDMDPIQASIGCMAQIAMTGPNITNIKLGDTVIVFGLGMVGILAGLMYQLKGAKVIGVDPVEHRCELAKKLGIETVVGVAPDKQVEELLKITDNEGADVTVDAAGHAAVCVNCIKTTKNFGQVILLGTPRVEMQGNINESFYLAHTNCLTIRGAHMWQFPVDNQRGVSMSVNWSFKAVFDLISTGKLNVMPLISHVIKPEQAADAYHGLQFKQNEYTCAVIDWRK
ncbi:MAG: zinc-binding alcohol dehydrogenase [Sporomusaceae bacterium]|nr:zinc-binding alcohol dehydrogenase [Sporomusaceae bacterium]